MKNFVKNIDSSSHQELGGKAKNLKKLEAIGCNIPKWGVIPADVILDQFPSNFNLDAEAMNSISLKVPLDLLGEISSFFSIDEANKRFAVRSSVIDEDGENHSFAGLFETELNVPVSRLEEAIIKVWKSTLSKRVLEYRKEKQLELSASIGVIVQEMINPDISGVAFGIDPISRKKGKRVISSVYGLGEGIVSGALNADTFFVEDSIIEKQIVSKTFKFSQKTDAGIEIIEVEDRLKDRASLSDEKILELSKLLGTLEKELGGPQDIEFSYCGDELFLLQTRPVTFKEKEQGEYTLWDNSNIIESYPGVTTPLTFSFIIKMYEMVYRQLAGLMGVKEKEIENRKEVFTNTLGLIRGRVYYNLLSWYKMIAMVPGYSLNARFMETMMGVKERFDLKEDYRMSKRIARLRIIGMVFRMIWLQMRLPGERRRFKKHLDSTMDEYGKLNFWEMEIKDIVQHYIRFEESLLLKWKAPMINDFFAMIWFGVLKSKSQKIFPDGVNIHNDLLCGSQDILSIEPVHMCLSLSKVISQNKECKELFVSRSENEILDELNQGKHPEVKNLVDEYIHKFGNRCVGELKLETVSYAQEPAQFVKIIKSYVEQNITVTDNGNNIEKELRENAEEKVKAKFKGKPLKKWWFNYILRKTRDLVSNRENLRYERTRGFGMVRKMFVVIGEKLAQEGHIENGRDVFYLELNQIKGFKDGAISPTIWKDVNERKKEFSIYNKQQNPEERFYTYGNDFSDEYIYSKEKLEPIEGDLVGIGCCPGRVHAKVRVVKHPQEVDSLNGDILVTSSTDPGWVTLFPSASGIIVERGSLLSHSAIVSREMGIPCIVSVTGLLRTLKTGDEVIMNGSTGEIQLVEK